MEKINIFIGKSLKVVPGEYFGLLSFIFGASFIFFAYFRVPGFSMLKNTISSLGVIPGETSIFLNTGLILTGIFVLPLFLDLGRSIQTEGSKEIIRKISLRLSIIVNISVSLIGCFPAYNNIIGIIHGIISGIFFFGGLILSILLNLLIWSDPKFSKFQSWIGILITGIFSFYILTGWAIAEWSILFACFFWVFQISIYTIFKKKLWIL